MECRVRSGREREYDKVIEKELYPTEGQLKMGEVVRKVSEATGNDAVLVTDVGQNQMMGVRYFKYKQTRSVVTSGGLGTMGLVCRPLWALSSGLRTVRSASLPVMGVCR